MEIIDATEFTLPNATKSKAIKTVISEALMGSLSLTLPLDKPTVY